MTGLALQIGNSGNYGLPRKIGSRILSDCIIRASPSIGHRSELLLSSAMICLFGYLFNRMRLHGT